VVVVCLDVVFVAFFFFFSSRRRHTRSKRDWSSDVCSSDLKEIVVFIIGMRVNKWYAVHHWLPIFTAMPPMIKELYTNQAELGFLSMENYFGLRTTHMIQYWK